MKTKQIFDRHNQFLKQLLIPKGNETIYTSPGHLVYDTIFQQPIKTKKNEKDRA